MLCLSAFSVSCTCPAKQTSDPDSKLSISWGVPQDRCFGEDKEELLENNYRQMMKRDREDPEKGEDYIAKAADVPAGVSGARSRSEEPRRERATS